MTRTGESRSRSYVVVGGGDHVAAASTRRLGTTRRRSEPGLLLVGDAAHVISPVSVNGLNFAVLEAVEAANWLAGSVVADPVEPTGVDSVGRARRSQLDREQAQQKRVELDTAHRGPAAAADATRARVGAGERRGWSHAAGFAR